VLTRLALLVFVAAGAAAAAPITLLDPTPADNDFFGCAVTVAGTSLLVGARFDDTAATDAGVAYLLDPASGALESTLLEPAPGESDQLGSAVAALGSDLFVGAPHFNSGAAHAGAVFVFRAGGIGTLTKPAPAFDDLFGFAVAAAGNTVVVGAPFDGTGAPGAGAAYLFDAQTGALTQTLANPTPEDYDLFGNAVAAAGTFVVVGAPFDDTTKPNAGAAYVFDAASGALLHTLQAPRPKEGDLFGSAVAASDTMIAVGAPYDDTVATNAGAVHLFDAATGTLVHTFLNPEDNADDRFGSAVAIAGGGVLIGAPFDDTGAADAGIAYLFDALSGALLTTFDNPTPAPGDQFGASLAAGGNLVAVGSWLDDTAAAHGGAVYVFSDQIFPPPPTWPTATTITTTTLAGAFTTTITFSTSTTSSTASTAPGASTTSTTSSSTSSTIGPGVGVPTTTTTTPEPTLACATTCDDHDPCTIDDCAEGVGCQHTPEIGFDAVLCRLDGLDAMLHGLSPLALGGRRLTATLEQRVALARRLVDSLRRVGGRRALRRLGRAERVLARFTAAVRLGTTRGRIARVASGNVLAIAADAAQQLPALRAAVR